MYEQKENENGYIIYINKINNKIIYNDPKLTDMLDKINQKYNKIKFTIYRCGLKLLTIKESLFTLNIPYKLVLSVLERHRLNNIDNNHAIKPNELVAFVHDLFFASEKFGYFLDEIHFNLNNAVSVLCNFIWNIFDINRNISITVIQLKFILLLTSNTESYNELVNELFHITSDHNNCVTHKQFEQILIMLTKLIIYIDINSTNIYNGNNINKIINKLYITYSGLYGLNKYEFIIIWLNMTNNSKLLNNYNNLLSLLYRLISTKYLIHNYKCYSCKQLKIRGLRFKCKNCKHFSLCMNCFTNGYNDKKHLLNHKICEISTNILNENILFKWLRKCINLFKRKSSYIDTENNSNIDHMNVCHYSNNNTKLYNETTSSTIVKNLELMNITDNYPDLTAITLGGNNQNKLYNNFESFIYIIDVLLQENKNFIEKVSHETQFKITNPTLLNKIEIYNNSLNDKIMELRNLVHHSKPLHLPKSSSTPYRNETNNKKNKINLSTSLTKTIQGAEVNRSFLDDNKSNYSINDLSSWLHLRESLRLAPSNDTHDASKNDHGLPKSVAAITLGTSAISTSNIDTKIVNFKELLYKVKEIIDDSYSDNIILSDTTKQLEIVLDDIIGDEEQKRQLFAKNI